MSSHALYPLLQSVHGTEPFLGYCRQRHIPFAQDATTAMQPSDFRRWNDALFRLPKAEQAQIHRELESVSEMADSKGSIHLLAALGGSGLPPEHIPAGAPLALWMLLHHPDTFCDVLEHHESQQGDSWRHAEAPRGLSLTNAQDRSTALASSLTEFFQATEGSGRFCIVHPYRVGSAYCFEAHVADRPHLVSSFTDDGLQAMQQLRPVFSVSFVYCPEEGLVLLRSRLRAQDGVLDLVRRFGRSVLGTDPGERFLEEAYHLDLLKGECRLQPDGEDMEMVRVKTLHLRYPSQRGRRQIRLETLSSDEPSAMQELLSTHFPAGQLAQLQVCHAELQVRLRVNGRSRNHLIRLWPGGSNLTPTLLGRRFWYCLKRWGLSHVRASLEFLLALLDGDPACVAHDDFQGEHGQAVALWQRMGFVAAEPLSNPAAGCPHCGEGKPYRLGARLLCNRCHSTVDPRSLLVWPLDRQAFLRWLAAELGLEGGVRAVDERLWQMGTLEENGMVAECFYRRPGPLSAVARGRLAAYRGTLLLYGCSQPPEGDSIPCVSLLEILRLDESLALAPRAPLLERRGNVRFDAHSGALWLGDAWLGEVPLGSKEFFFLDCLTAHLDSFVSYADLRHEVLRRSGSSDTTEEATFCQNLKSRIKKRWIPKIDRLIATTNKADGYRLRRHAELC